MSEASLFANETKSHPTAIEVINGLGVDQSKYMDKVVLITGASSGIGVETARAFASLGCVLYLPVRDEKKAAAVVQDIHTTHPNSVGKIHLLHVDLNSLASVRHCAANFLSKSKQLNILIANAGVMACPEGETADGFEIQFGSNHLAHFLLVQLLLSTLLSSSSPALASRVVTVSSSGHAFSPILFGDYNQKKKGYDRWVAYGQSKTANIYLATEIERRYGAQGLHGMSVHPGAIATPLLKYMMEKPLSDQEWEEMGIAPGTPMEQIVAAMKTVPQGAATTITAALSPEFEHKAGLFLEDCAVAKPKAEGKRGPASGGFVPWAYNHTDAARLWDESLNLVGN